MKVEKQLLATSKTLELWSPPEGFDENFISAVVEICQKTKELKKSYLLFKKNGAQNTLFFAFLFHFKYKMESNELTTEIMSEILELFKEEIEIDAICLNSKKQLIDDISSIAAPFYKSI